MDQNIHMVYLASPYSAHTPDGGRDDELETIRYMLACEVCMHFMKRGVLVYSPIVHWHVIDRIADGTIGYEDYLAADSEMIKRCDEVCVLQIPGWEQSRGVAVELELAKRYNKVISHATYKGGIFNYVTE